MLATWAVRYRQVLNHITHLVHSIRPSPQGVLSKLKNCHYTETIWTGSWNQTSTGTCMWASNHYCRYYYCSHYKHNIKHKKTTKPKPLRTATGKAKCLPYNSHTSPIIEDSILWRQTSVPDFYTKEKWYRNLGCWNLFKRSYSAFLLFDYFDYLSAPQKVWLWCFLREKIYSDSDS